ncbi:MAG: peptidylprolyl isomerase [Nitrospiraceae bacterium]|nr:peptidylprolyl isomerase [Nitrospiraceae bacterium]
MKKIIRLFVITALFLISIYSVSSDASILLDRVVAIVNQDVITWGDLYKAMEFEASEKMRGIKPEEKRKIFKESEGFFLESMINMTLQLQAAKQVGINISSEDVNEAIADIKKKYNLDDAALVDFLKKEGMTLDEYKKKLAEQLMIGRIITQQVKSKVVVSDKDVEKYILEGNDPVLQGEAYKISQIFFKNPSVNTDKKTLEEKANTLIQNVKGGTNFADAAKKYSEDSSSSLGGDLGFVKKDAMAKEFADVITKMNVGDISEPFWTANGLHIVKLQEKIEQLSGTALKDKAKSRLYEIYFVQKYKNWLRGLRDNSSIETKL